MWDPVIPIASFRCRRKHWLDYNAEMLLPTRGRICRKNHGVCVCLCCSTPVSGTAECLSCCKEIRVGICNKWFTLKGIKTIFKISGRKKGRDMKISQSLPVCPCVSFSLEPPAIATHSAAPHVGCTRAQIDPSLTRHLTKIHMETWGRPHWTLRGFGFLIVKSCE